MELPSMVHRSGDTLIVRSVVSGNQLYLDQGAGGVGGGAGGGTMALHHSNTPSSGHSHNFATHNSNNNNSNNNSRTLEQQLEMLRMATAAAAAAQQQQQQHYLQQQNGNSAFNPQQQQQQQQQQQTTASSAMELKDEGLPQCKIKRNYSCTYCTYFTQNPRCHLTHLRDVHGEKIVINKCKLCLYASRHFQKLVRHMKMVHGCTDGISGAGHGQSRGKRGMSREARKRKLEQSVGLSMGNAVTPEEVKREMEIQQAAYYKQQEEQKAQQLLANQAATNVFMAVYGQQFRDRDSGSLKSRGKFDQQTVAGLSTSSQRSSPTTNNNNNNISNNNNSAFSLQPTNNNVGNRNIELSPSPTGSTSTPSPAAIGIGSGGTGTGTGTGTPSSSSTPTPHSNSNALSLTYVDEPQQNRLLKCSICDFTTLYRAELMSHETDEHCKTKFFRCEKCSYVTHIKTRFSKHVKYHSMPMIKCVTCDFRTPYKWNLDRHMKNHGGTGPFKCAACDFTADIKQSLTVHEMNHHVPPVGHAAGMSLARRRNKVGGTDLCEDFLSDSADMLDDQYNNNNLDEYEEALLASGEAYAEVGDGLSESYAKRIKYEDEEPTDLSQKGGSSDTSSVHNQSLTPMKAKRPVPNLIPIPKVGNSVLNLSKDLAVSRSALTDIASIFFSEKQLSELLQPLEKFDAPQLSPTTTITSISTQNSRSMLHKKPGSFFDKLKSSALANSGGPNENLICPCGHMAKCLSESIIHRKTCQYAAIADDDIEEEQDDGDGRLEIDFRVTDDDDKQSHSALNLVTGSTRCQHCRHRCKSSADLLNHLKHCNEAAVLRCGNESYDSLSGESSSTARTHVGVGVGDLQHPMENRVFVWNKMPHNNSGNSAPNNNTSNTDGGGSQNSETQSPRDSNTKGAGTSAGGGGTSNGSNEENSYYGVETAPGYGEVTKKMTPEEEAANSSLKKVYKCPHCSFWASTASRFHVHIVGHLNKKPFECSLCSYRSNWRWDITKHIRLKTIRDPSHKNARVLMNDETGRRNYTKYNKYITLMKVTEEDGDPKLMKSGEMTPNQVASLSFLNDFNKNVAGGHNSHAHLTHLNGLRDDVTLEPVLTSKSNGPGAVDQITDHRISLPLLATVVNAAMTQQHQQKKQQQQQQQEEHTAMITPSVTISAVKRSPTQLIKPSDDLVTDVKEEGNEKKTYYRCRKCSFRHANRDAVLAHVRVHYQDGNFASMLTSPKSLNNNNNHQQPLQVTVNSNLYNMNEVLAAMCLSQQQQQQRSHANSPTTGNNNTQQQQQQQQSHSILSAGLLQQAIQGVSGTSATTTTTTTANSQLSGLALALAGKSPTKLTNNTTAATILEHGEQKASQNEASAPRRPPATSPISTLTSTKQQQHAFIGGGAGGVSGVGSDRGVGGSGGGGATTALQHLLTSPRDNNTQQQQQQAHNTTPTINTTTLNSQATTTSATNITSPSTTSTQFIGAGGINCNKNNHNNINHNNSVMGLTTTTTTPIATSAAVDSAAATTITTTPLSPNSIVGGSSIRHCRLKHAGDVRIETLDRAAIGDRNAPVYRPLGNGNNNNDVHYGLNFKTMQQQHQQLQQQQQAHLLNTNNNNNNNNNNKSNSNNNSVLKNDAMLHSPLAAAAAAAAAAAVGANTPQDLQAAAFYLACRAAGASGDELLLHQNDQIEITRLSAGNASSNLTQLLEREVANGGSATVTGAGNAVGGAGGAVGNVPQNNSKCKQQKCPLCPYISESKSQMNYHISLHKPTQYECPLCTFVCAKKQHLSSHMRSVHQQHGNAAAAAASSGAASALNLDFSMALQLAAAAQTQQDAATALTTPLAIDLSALKHTFSSSSAPTTSHSQHSALAAASGEQSVYKLVSYCAKCPARFAQKPRDTPHSLAELQEHAKCHGLAETATTYKCEFCDFKAPHETLIQAHRYVHSQHYQDKCAELYKLCKEDSEYPAPKLMQMTLTKNRQTPETVWIVDTELVSSGQQQQQSHISSSSTSGGIFGGGSSLLKKQLEAGPAPIATPHRDTPSPPLPPATQHHKPTPNEEDSSCSNTTPSTSASVATSDLAADGACSEFNSAAPSPAPLEKCLHCPYETSSATQYKSHLQHHICISHQTLAHTCEHCDYTDADREQIEEHTRVHFNAIEKLKSVAFFTSYDNLELNVEPPAVEKHEAERDGESECEGGEHDNADEDDGSDHEQQQQQQQQIKHIKQEQAHEHNNNNEEDAINENTLQEQQQQQQQQQLKDRDEKAKIEDKCNLPPPPPPARSMSPATTTNEKKSCTKIILYKNDGCLSIKRNHDNNNVSDNISDRLRRRISRHGNNNNHHHHQQQQQQQHLNGSTDDATTPMMTSTGTTSTTTPITTTTTAATQSHKTILVNAKTGQVISRN